MRKKAGGQPASDVSPQSSPELVVITGLSGSGKATVLKCLEDLGYYSVDNLPTGLIAKFADLIKASPNVSCAALGVDIREGSSLAEFPRIYEKLRHEIRTTLVFLEAEDAALLRRFSETRRPHPLGKDETVAEKLKQEREALAPIRAVADHIIDTSRFTVHELREAVAKTFTGTHHPESKLMISVTSFGYRNGVPTDSDLVFDVRFLPNPNYIPEFKHLTGKNPRVAHYIRSFPQTQEFMDRITQLLVYLIPHYVREGKSYLTIAFGCTGGQHRSVMMAAEIKKRLTRSGFSVKEVHRDAPRK
jgi:UPF0042 nucleotide-binding protein